MPTALLAQKQELDLGYEAFTTDPASSPEAQPPANADASAEPSAPDSTPTGPTPDTTEPAQEASAQATSAEGPPQAAETTTAQPPTRAQLNEARQLGKHGLQALDAKRYAEAEAHLSAAIKIYPAPTLHVARAKARLAVDDLVGASEDLTLVQNMEIPRKAPRAFRRARAFAAKTLPGLQQRLATLTVEVQGEPGEVTVNGKPWPTSEQKAINPGRHLVRISLGPREDSAKIDLGEGQTGSVLLRLPPALDPSPFVMTNASQGAGSLDTATNAHSSTGLSYTPAYVAAALTAAALVASTVIGTLYLIEREQYHDLNDSNASLEAKQESYDQAKTLRYVSSGLLGLAAVAGGVTTYLALNPLPTEGAPTGGLQHAELRVGGRF